MTNTTTESVETAAPPPPPDYVMATAIRNIYIWVLVGVGLPGNVACLVTVLSMRVTTATFYVALLAVADSVALLLKLLFHQKGHASKTELTCVFHSLPTYANWVLTLICFERFVAIRFPLKKQVYFTKTRVYISVVVLALALALCFSPAPFLYTPIKHECNLKTSMDKFNSYFYEYFRSSVYFFIPFLLIAVLTILTILGLQRGRQARQRMRTDVTRASDGGVERSNSIMMLCAGLVLLVLTFPACLYHLYLKKRYDTAVIADYVQAYLLYQIITLLTDTNHAVNFIIYFLSAAKFRKRFVEMVKRCLCLA